MAILYKSSLSFLAAVLMFAQGCTTTAKHNCEKVNDKITKDCQNASCKSSSTYQGKKTTTTTKLPSSNSSSRELKLDRKCEKGIMLCHFPIVLDPKTSLTTSTLRHKAHHGYMYALLGKEPKKAKDYFLLGRMKGSALSTLKKGEEETLFLRYRKDCNDPAHDDEFKLELVHKDTASGTCFKRDEITISSNFSQASILTTFVDQEAVNSSLSCIQEKNPSSVFTKKITREINPKNLSCVKPYSNNKVDQEGVLYCSFPMPLHERAASFLFFVNR